MPRDALPRCGPRGHKNETILKEGLHRGVPSSSSCSPSYHDNCTELGSLGWSWTLGRKSRFKFTEVQYCTIIFFQEPGSFAELLRSPVFLFFLFSLFLVLCCLWFGSLGLEIRLLYLSFSSVATRVALQISRVSGYSAHRRTRFSRTSHSHNCDGAGEPGWRKVK